MKQKLFTSLLAVGAIALCANSASAAVVVTATDWTTGALSANFTTEGTTDWVIWTSDDTTDALSIREEKSGGTAISNLSAINAQSSGAGGFNADVSDGPGISAFTAGLSFSYTDGTGAITSPDTTPGAAFRRWYGDVWGSYAQFTVPVLTTDQTLKLYLGTVNNALAFVRYSLDGGSTFSSLTSSALSDASGETTGIFQFDFSDATATSMLVQVTQASNGQNGGNSGSDYLVVGGATLSAVPEPSTFAMLLGGIGMLTMLRRRRA